MTEIIIALRELLAALNGLAVGGVALAFLVLAGVGTITMAAIQVLKELTPLRCWFHKRQVTRWLIIRSKELDRERQDVDNLSNGDNSSEADKAIVVELINSWAELSVGGDLSAFFSPPVEEMAAQMKQAVPVMLDEGSRYKYLITILSLFADKEDLQLILANPNQENKSRYFDARARVARRIERNIDGLQISTGDHWKFLMQAISLGSTAVIVELAVYASGAVSTLTYVIAAPIGLLGGYFAPVLRDLVAALQKLRQA